MSTDFSQFFLVSSSSLGAAFINLNAGMPMQWCRLWHSQAKCIDSRHISRHNLWVLKISFHRLKPSLWLIYKLLTALIMLQLKMLIRDRNIALRPSAIFIGECRTNSMWREWIWYGWVVRINDKPFVAQYDSSRCPFIFRIYHFFNWNRKFDDIFNSQFAPHECHAESQQSEL